MKKQLASTLFLLVLFSTGGLAAPADSSSLSDDELLAAATNWLARQGAGATHTIQAPHDMDLPPLKVLLLEPKGYLVMSGDRRLPPVVAFSLQSDGLFSAQPGNALQALLARDAAAFERALNLSDSPPAAYTRTDSERGILNAMNAYSSQWQQLLHPEWTRTDPLALVTNVPPLLTTTWNQTRHYNFYCPGPNPDYGYENKAPAGCVPVAFAQIMRHHEWPRYGAGSYQYTDNSGSITGTYSAHFEVVYQWSDMQTSYNYAVAEPTNAVHAVAILMAHLGIAGEIDYEANGSSAISSRMATRAREHFYYEPGSYRSITNATEANLLLANEVSNARPCLVSIPDHAIVCDGHGNDSGNDYFHINYGWGGENNGWYLINSVAGASLDNMITDFQPALAAMVDRPAWTSFNPAVSLEWQYPATRAGSITNTRLLTYETIETPMLDPSDSYDYFTITSESDYKDWALSTTGHTGSCYYKTAGGYGNKLYHITQAEPFIPAADAALSFFYKSYFLADQGTVAISTDDTNYTVIATLTNTSRNWTSITCPLNAYTGQTCRLRFEYLTGSYYSSGGLWMDDITLINTAWNTWYVFTNFGPSVTSAVVQLPENTHTYALEPAGPDGWSNVNPPFTLQVGDGDAMPYAWEILHSLDTNLDDGSLDPDGDTASNYQEYIADTDPQNPADFLQLLFTYPTPTTLDFGHPSSSSRYYTLQCTDTLLPAAWSNCASERPGTGGFLSYGYDVSGTESLFLRVQVRFGE